MQHPLADRADRIRLPVTELAARAGLNLHTVHKLFNGAADPRVSTVEAVETALVAEERALLAHLLRLHPQAASAASRPEASPAELLAPAARPVVEGSRVVVAPAAPAEAAE